MAYDPKDPADKKILDDAVAAALAEAQTEHEADIAGLKTKNAALLKKIKEGGEGDPAEVARLEAELETSKAALKTAEKSLKTITTERDTAVKGLESESAFTHKLLVDNGLTEALVGANVAAPFLPAVKAMLASKVVLKAEGDERKAFVGDKALGDFVKEWSQGDDGKHYIAAPNNGGGGSGGSKGTTGKTMTRTAYNEMAAANPSGVATFFSEGGTLTD